MKVVNDIHIPPKSARALAVEAGQTVRIIDTAGRQPGDFVAFKADDLSVKFSQARTRVENRTVRVTQGHALWTNTQPPRVMFTIAADMCGTHDLLYTPCCRYALEKRFGLSCDGCIENLANALKPWGILAHEISDPLNLFFSVHVDGEGEMEIREPTSKPGDFIDLKAEMDCVVAVSTCAVPLSGKENTSYEIRILEP